MTKMADYSKTKHIWKPNTFNHPKTKYVSFSSLHCSALTLWQSILKSQGEGIDESVFKYVFEVRFYRPNNMF